MKSNITKMHGQKHFKKTEEVLHLRFNDKFSVKEPTETF